MAGWPGCTAELDPPDDEDWLEDADDEVPELLDEPLAACWPFGLPRLGVEELPLPPPSLAAWAALDEAREPESDCPPALPERVEPPFASLPGSPLSTTVAPAIPLGLAATLGPPPLLVSVAFGSVRFEVPAPAKPWPAFWPAAACPRPDVLLGGLTPAGEIVDPPPCA